MKKVLMVIFSLITLSLLYNIVNQLLTFNSGDMTAFTVSILVQAIIASIFIAGIIYIVKTMKKESR